MLERLTRLNWRHVWILYLREIRAALRERSIVFNSILIPIFLYPFLLWATMTGLTFVMGQTEGLVARVAVADWPKGHPGLRKKLERNDRIQLIQPSGGEASRASEEISEGRSDALLEFLPATAGKAALAGNFEARITYNQAKERSTEARKRVSRSLEDYRRDWLNREARRRGIDTAQWQAFTISEHNLASKKQMGVFLLGLIAPIIFVIMVAAGCLYPAIDTLAGERERQTWETLISTAASRLSIVTAKYLYVASMGGLAGILNLLAVSLTAKPIFGPLFERAGRGVDFSFPPSALPVALVAAVLLAGFVAAAMMLLAAFARTFKEGQSSITPFYMILLAPLVFLQVPGIKLSPAVALLPVVNLTLMVREAVSGTFHWPAIGVTLLVSLALIALFIRLATFILQFEEALAGASGGSLVAFLKQRLKPARRA